MESVFESTFENCAEHTSKIAGEYLETLGKFDLRELSKDEWFNLIHLISKSYYDKFKEQESIPF